MIEQRIRNGAHFAFTDRWGGVSTAPYGELNLGGAVGDDPAAVRENRCLAAHGLGLDPADVVWMNQVHGAEVAVVAERQQPGEAPAVDAVVTDRPLALAVLTADCTPVLLADPVAGIVGAAHAGRPGLAAGVVPALVAAVLAQGASPERIVAAIGPAVCGRCYEVPAELRAEVTALVPAAYAQTSWGTPALDVPGGVAAQLAEAGITEVVRSSVCTLESADHFSYRREQRTGRLASYVWLGSELS
ncbi:peptidoglycan editing factor PgeF [Kitasatospora sp. GP82]|uniref:peptidoglycan editing factor PgeF n=1 Tax=Kitasatospora sp. GP82 TaxID=3035089 RepID=UPI002474C147|nr:peptidoglycan editing factor PgeF [Kitasatospora sp. GP82]MDH6127202.1 YfiH family protein [Kitasatospora sp. GP82]